jgi:hypothetical protein
MTSRGDSSWNGEVTLSVYALRFGVPREDVEDAETEGAMATDDGIPLDM